MTWTIINHWNRWPPKALSAHQGGEEVSQRVCWYDKSRISFQTRCFYVEVRLGAKIKMITRIFVLSGFEYVYCTPYRLPSFTLFFHVFIYLCQFLGVFWCIRLCPYLQWDALYSETEWHTFTKANGLCFQVLSSSVHSINTGSFTLLSILSDVLYYCWARVQHPHHEPTRKVLKTKWVW